MICILELVLSPEIWIVILLIWNWHHSFVILLPLCLSLLIILLLLLLVFFLFLCFQLLEKLISILLRIVSERTLQMVSRGLYRFLVLHLLYDTCCESFKSFRFT